MNSSLGQHELPRILIISPPLDNSGGIGTLYQNVASNIEGLAFIRFVDSRGKSKISLLPLLRIPFVLLKLTYVSITWKPDLIHINISGGASIIRKCFVALFIRLFLHKPYVVQLHSSSFVTQIQSLPDSIKKIILFILNSAARFLTLGEYWAKQVSEMGVKRELVRYFPLGISRTEQYTPLEQSQQTIFEQDFKLYLMFIGPLNHKKGFDLLVAALERLKNENLYLVAFGDGDIHKWRKLCESRGINAVFCGQVGNELTRSVLSLVDIFILPSLNENMPVSVLEAAYARTAIVSSQVGSLDEYFDINSIAYIKTGNLDSLTDKLKIIVEDHDYRRSLATSAHHIWKENFDASDTTRRLVSEWKRHIPSPLRND